MSKAREGGKRVAWSDDDLDDPSEVYDKLKRRASLKRKRARGSLKAKRKDNGAQTSKGRGKKPAKNSPDFDEDVDDYGMEYTLPDYLQRRREHHERRVGVLKEAGLKLPPNYDDVDFSDDDRLEHLQEKPDFPNMTPVAQYKDKQLPYSLGIVPAPIAQWLRDYQVQGVAFLHKLFVYQTGGILGDDMGRLELNAQRLQAYNVKKGLGKTVQVIAFLAAAYGKTGDERDGKRLRKMRRARVKWYPRVLIVCPGTLIENWKAELGRWGWWHVDVCHGPTKDTAIEAATTGMLEIMITTYATYRNSKSAINYIEWDCVIADECHQIKGMRSETTQAMNEVNALCRIGLTGTAIQNNYLELWACLPCTGLIGRGS